MARITPETTIKNITAKDDESASRLIALSGIHNGIYSGYFDKENCVSYCIDMIRINVSINPKMLDAFMQLFDTWTVPERSIYYRSNKLNGYRFLWSLKFGKDEVTGDDVTIAVGLCYTDYSGKIDESKGFLEFNPQKCKDKGIALIRKMLDKGARLEPVRFDLAIDFPVDRNTVRLIKDKRKYGCIMGNSFTEYLGSRNTAGFVKVYDKKVQYKLDFPLTRVELTCAADWKVKDILEKLPKVFCYSNADLSNLKKATKAFAVAVQAHVANGDSLEPWLNLLNKTTRSKVREVFSAQSPLQYNREYISQALLDVHTIVDGTWCEADEYQPYSTVVETIRYPQGTMGESTAMSIKSIELCEDDCSWLDDIE